MNEKEKIIGVFSNIADAIREKDGTSQQMTPEQMSQRILDIPSGGGGGFPWTAYNNITINFKCTGNATRIINLTIFHSQSEIEKVTLSSYGSTTVTCTKNDVLFISAFTDIDYLNVDYIDNIVPTNDNQSFNITVNSSCYLKDSLITLSNFSKKKVQDITYDDEILVWNFDEGKFDVSKPLWIKKQEFTDHYNVCKFDNGIELKLTGTNKDCHRLFSTNKQRFEYANNIVGDDIAYYDSNKILNTKLVECEYKQGFCEFYNIITKHHMNVFVNDILTSSKMNNLYPIKDMMYVKEDRPYRDISEFNLTKNQIKFYDGCRLSESNMSNEEIMDFIFKKSSTDQIIEGV